MKKAEKILEKHIVLNDCIGYLGSDGRLYKAITNALEEAINYTHCSTQLKDKEVPNFDEWLRNFKKAGDDCYWLNKEVLYCKEAMKLHYDNLPNRRLINFFKNK